MNDFDNQPDAPAEFEADGLNNDSADEAVASSLALDLSDEETQARARVMRANLDQFDLDEEDLALLAGEAALAEAGDVAAGLPVLAVVGRPNVGKSTLVNRILGRREAVVQDTPGVTRDRVSYPAEWAGRDFTLVDTGGWEIDVKGLDRSVAEQAEIAVDLADAVVLVLDATVGVTASDERIVEMLRSKKKPIILAANKVDSPLQEADAAYLWSLGLGEPYPISALHGRGTGDLLDAIMEVLPTESAVATALPSGGPRRVALVGRPNVGKSSLLNALAGGERVILHDVGGTQVVERGLDLVHRGAREGASGSHASIGHDLLRERLGGLEARGVLRGAKDGDPVVQDRIRDARDERGLGADDHEVDILGRGTAHDVLRVQRIHGQGAAQLLQRGVTRLDDKRHGMLRGGRSYKRTGDRVFATSVTNEKNLHATSLSVFDGHLGRRWVLWVHVTAKVRRVSVPHHAPFGLPSRLPSWASR